MVFEFFRKYLFSNRAGAVVRRISWLTILGLGISVAALILVISVMTALNKSVEKRTLSIEPHLTIDFPGITKTGLIEVHPLALKLKMNTGYQVHGFENQDVILRTMDGRFRGAVAKGLTPHGLDLILKQNQKANWQKSFETNVSLNEGEVLIGSDLAVSLGVFEGDSLLVVPPETLLLPSSEAPNYERVRVQRIISTSLADVDLQSVFYIYGSTLRRLEKSVSRKVGLDVWIPEPQKVDSVKNQIKNFPEVNVQTWKEKNSALFLSLRLEKVIISLFLTLASLIAGFSLVSVLVLLISQKRREIGILQAIGMSSRRVKKMFLKIGLLLAACGLGGGLLLGILFSLYLEFFPLTILPDIYYDSAVTAYVDWQFVFIVFFVGALLSFLGSKFSSQSAAMVTPTEALRVKN